MKSKSGGERLKPTIRGWSLLVEWKDGSQDWVTLKDLKASYPVEIAEYAAANRLVEEPAFKWWVPYTLLEADAQIWSQNAEVSRRGPTVRC